MAVWIILSAKTSLWWVNHVLLDFFLWNCKADTNLVKLLIIPCSIFKQGYKILLETSCISRNKWKCKKNNEHSISVRPHTICGEKALWSWHMLNQHVMLSVLISILGGFYCSLCCGSTLQVDCLVCYFIWSWTWFGPDFEYGHRERIILYPKRQNVSTPAAVKSISI